MMGDGVQFSLGFMKHCPVWSFGSEVSFGQPGTGGSLGFADPKAGIGYAYVTNQIGTALTGDPRDLALRNAVYSAIPQGDSNGEPTRRIASVTLSAGSSRICLNVVCTNARRTGRSASCWTIRILSECTARGKTRHWVIRERRARSADCLRGRPEERTETAIVGDAPCMAQEKPMPDPHAACREVPSGVFSTTDW
jgi:hypothetical protein